MHKRSLNLLTYSFTPLLLKKNMHKRSLNLFTYFFTPYTPQKEYAQAQS